jgi:hypothetical protein
MRPSAEAEPNCSSTTLRVPKSNQSADVDAIPSALASTCPNGARHSAGPGRSPPIKHGATNRRAGSTASARVPLWIAARRRRLADGARLPQRASRGSATIAPTGAEDCFLEARLSHKSAALRRTPTRSATRRGPRRRGAKSTSSSPARSRRGWRIRQRPAAVPDLCDSLRQKRQRLTPQAVRLSLD